jgi:23S rRNA pseudouridine2457 synthase|tara:strand:+ start:52899 stop:53447 length:549 start_codon:yes stop_codon:yes gene_type:complete
VAEIILFNKPFGVLCQFTDPEGRPSLSDYIKTPNFYAAGRLDNDSEGLLILTDDGKLQARITSPKHKMAKIYLAQVEGVPNESDLSKLRKGIKLKDILTRPADCRLVEEPEWLWPRNPPIRDRKNIPTSWIELKLKEGKNRQVRRMTAAAGYPTLRLVRIAVGNWDLAELPPGEQIRTITED